MFANRRSAGRELSQRLQHLREEKPIVLAMPRGGVPVGFEIAEGLDAPLDIVLVRSGYLGSRSSRSVRSWTAPTRRW